MKGGLPMALNINRDNGLQSFIGALEAGIRSRITDYPNATPIVDRITFLHTNSACANSVTLLSGAPSQVASALRWILYMLCP